MSVGKCCSWDRSMSYLLISPFLVGIRRPSIGAPQRCVCSCIICLWSCSRINILWDTACLNKHQPIRVKMAELLVCIKILYNFTIFWVLNYYIKESSLESFEDSKGVMSNSNSICVQLWTFLFGIIWDTRLLKFSWVKFCYCPSLYNILQRNLGDFTWKISS